MRNSRLIEAAVAALGGAGGRLQITNLNKALFYFDLIMLRDHGASYTGVSYLAYERGPVVDHYSRDLIQALVESGKAVQENDGMAKPVVLLDPTPWDLESKLQICATVGGWANRQTAARLSEFTHANLGWQAARRRGDSERINMVLAMQQVIDEDPWVSAPLLDLEKMMLVDRLDQEAEPW